MILTGNGIQTDRKYFIKIEWCYNVIRLTVPVDRKKSTVKNPPGGAGGSKDESSFIIHYVKVYNVIIGKLFTDHYTMK